MSTVTIRQAVAATELVAVDTIVEPEGNVPIAQPQTVFPQSVASGGPTPTGVILWTRINPDQYNPSQKLRLEVATDESFDEPVTRVEFPGPGVKATDNYTVRVDLNGLLDPDSCYYYRFGYGGVKSNTGRCRTLPTMDASPDSV